MKARFVSLLKRFPAFYCVVEKVYHRLSVRRLKEYLMGTRAREIEWATRHFRKGKADDWDKGDTDWIKGYWSSQDHSHRPFLIERISRFSPLSSVLEIGCNCGPNLCLLAKKFPNANIVGIDINPMAVQKGNEWLAKENCLNAKLLVGKADELERFRDKCFDIVFTDATLILIGPDKIEKVLKEIIRIARRALVFVEWHSFEPDHRDRRGLGVYHLGFWKRDYVALLMQLVQKEQIFVIKIPEDVWPAGGWKEVGAVIEVTLKQ